MNNVDSFLIENIRNLPVIASQDQEFWLSAIGSCPRVLEATDGQANVSGPEITSVSLAGLFAQCVQCYENLVRNGLLAGPVPSWDEVLREAAIARKQIVHLRLSRLFQWLNTTDSQRKDTRSTIKAVFDMARFLSIMPIDFIEYWRRYLATAGNHPSVAETRCVLQHVDTVLLAATIHTAAREARTALVQGYSRYALRVAHGYLNSGVEYADLVQEALVGLLVASERFDFLEHRRFAIFATTWMWQHVTRSVANDGQLIRVPVHAFQRRRQIQEELNQHLKEIGWAQSLGDLILSTGMALDECMPLLETALPPIRITAPKPELPKRHLIEHLLARNDELLAQVETNDFVEAVRAELRNLPEPCGDVIALRFGLGDGSREHTLEEIGQKYHLTRERIRQIEKKAFELLVGDTGAKLRDLRLMRHQRSQLSEDNLIRARRATARSLRVASCDEGLTAYHPFKADNQPRLRQRLNREFGSRQSSVRQSITIKGQIIAAFRGYREPMHTAELEERLRALFPLERHNENTLYSVMAANPDVFIPLGGGVFRLMMADSAHVGTNIDRDELVPTLVFDDPIEISANELKGSDATEPFPLSFDDSSTKSKPVDLPIHVLEQVVSSTEDLRKERFWSLGELEWTSQQRHKLLRWADTPGVDLSSASKQRITFNGLSFTGLEALSLTFLYFCSEIARKHAVEGDMWSHVSDALGKELRLSLFSMPGLPRRQVREATEEVCRRLKIRHGFGREGEQSWLRTVFLQFGLTRAGYKRLPIWLGDNALLPVTIQDLLNEHSHLYSPTFALLWRVLQRYRWRFCTESEARAAIHGNPWISDEDTEAILAASVSTRESEKAESAVEEQSTSPRTLLLPPLFRWTGAIPSFEIRLNKTPLDWTKSSRYVLTIANQRLPVIREEFNWHFEGISGSVNVGLSEATLKADLLDKGVSVLGEQIRINLTPEPDPFCIYDLETGRKLDLTRPPHQFSNPVALINRDGVHLSRTSEEYCRVFEGKWICWAFRDGLPRDLEVREGDLILWTAVPVEEDKSQRVSVSPVPSMVIHSSGGWWGEEVPISVTAPHNLQVLDLRTGSQVVTLSPVGPGAFRGRLLLLPDQDYSAGQVDYVDGSRLKRQSAEVRMPELCGVAIESETGWKALDSSRDIDISYFSARRLLVRLPSYWTGEQHTIEDWVLLEGDHFCHRPRRPISSLGHSLYGVGEPLTTIHWPIQSLLCWAETDQKLAELGTLEVGNSGQRALAASPPRIMRTRPRPHPLGVAVG